jgi:hypothetical protein
MAVASLLASTLPGSRAVAQEAPVDPRCSAGAVPLATQDACQKAIDLFRFMAPQLGIAVIGGNPVLGSSGSLGGFGRVSLGVRANSVSGRLPLASRVAVAHTGAVSSDYALEGQSIGLPVMDLAVGLFAGITLPGTRGLALDALVNAGWIPGRSDREISLGLPDGGLHVGYGARLVLLEESVVTPAMTATFVRRRLPTLELAAAPGGDALAFRDVSVRTDQWRLLFAKFFGPWDVSAGLGQDRYRSGAAIGIAVERDGIPTTAGPIHLTQALTRDNAFLGVATVLASFRVGFELGRVSGGSIRTFNQFGGRRADDALIYATLGARVVW